MHDTQGDSGLPKTAFTKYILVFLFLFAILERTGISVISFVAYQSSRLIDAEEINSQEESNRSAETESIKESLKEFLSGTNNLNIHLPLLSLDQKTKRNKNNGAYLIYHLSVPTPPPDNLA